MTSGTSRVSQRDRSGSGFFQGFERLEVLEKNPGTNSNSHDFRTVENGWLEAEIRLPKLGQVGAYFQVRTCC